MNLDTPDESHRSGQSSPARDAQDRILGGHPTMITRWPHAQPDVAVLEAVVQFEHGSDLSAVGWGPQLRRRFGYFTPDEVYQAVVAHLVRPEISWADIGCGRNVFPSNPRLARVLASRCQRLVGIDPDATILENDLVDERVQSGVEEYVPDQPFDLVTLRMVAEHVTRPMHVVESLARLTRLGGTVVVYTVNKWSPVSLAARIVPFSLHHPVKRLLWKTEEKDTFPVAYRMNTRRSLTKLFHANGFREAGFLYLDDCRNFAQYRFLHYLELAIQRLTRQTRLPYPDTCILAIYERV